MMGVVMGAPVQLNRANVDAIVGIVEATANLTLAAKQLGIKRNTLSKWLSKGRDESTDPDHLTVELARRVEAAEAVWAQRQVDRIEQAAKEPRTWQAAAWLLERRFPDEWGKNDRQRVELSSAAGGVLNLGVDLPAAAGDAAVDFVKTLGVVQGGAAKVAETKAG